MKPVKVASFGLGSIGLEALRHAAGQPWIEIVGAVDNDPAVWHRSLVELTGLGSLDGLHICPTIEELFREAQPDVILHAAAAKAAVAVQQIRPALECGLAVASTCGELIYPALQSPALARELEVLCQHTKSRLIATGANPGFVTDLLPICLTGSCRQVEQVRVERVADAAGRRRSEQAKLGCGADPDLFRLELLTGEAGPTGLRESAAVIAHALGWRLDEILAHTEPIVALQDIQDEFVAVAAGRVCGIHQHAVGRKDGVEKIVLDLRTWLGASEPRDEIYIRGRPDLDVTVRRGITADDATVAALINVVPRLLAGPPGLRLLGDVAGPGWSGAVR